MTSLDRRVALLTGCGQRNGIGAACALTLSRHGVVVAISDIPRRSTSGRSTPIHDALDALVDEIVDQGGTALSLRGDLLSEADVKKMVEEVLDHFGHLDILVNNAAAAHGPDRAEVDDVPLSAWDEVMNINARSAFLLSRATLPSMRQRGFGRIINISSAIVGQPRRLRAVYAASKAAVVGFTQGLAVDVADKGITVNAVCPGSILTARAERTAHRSGHSDGKVAFAESALTIPARRHGTPEDVAGMVAWLASEQAAYITGQSIFIDGGGIPHYRA
ncbi:SDR family NAD(P)-dependent oxidoreductase [Microvirga antarctica]|uniref:SDR family NAD(P)-dependent oxidoreductase n=1 Tax=Microvirga antarctica TaxID=2819233 RepID=UPI001B312B36|nr:SDR family oxidoreductase [Microvirga antarctica]